MKDLTLNEQPIQKRIDAENVRFLYRFCSPRNLDIAKRFSKTRLWPLCCLLGWIQQSPNCLPQPCRPSIQNYFGLRSISRWAGLEKTEGEMKKELVSTAKLVADRPTKNISRKPWETFKRFRGCEKFYGCVDKAGFWFDSAADFATATHWVAMFHGRGQLTEKEESEFMKESQCSIIHSDTLQRMYEAGLIK